MFTVLVDYETFSGRMCELANGRVVTPGSLVRWLDEAWAERVVFDGPDRVKNVSVRRRIFTGATRRSVEVRDRECFHPLCDATVDDCQVDHVEPWSVGGVDRRHQRPPGLRLPQPTPPPTPDPRRLHERVGRGEGSRRLGLSWGLRRVDAVTAPGPLTLGRGVVVMADGEIPAAWAGAPVVVVDEAAVAEPATCVAELHEAWAARRPVVVALAVDPARFREPESWAVEPWTLGPGFEAYLDRLHFLVWANNYDARADGEPVWWWARKAERLGAQAAPPNGPARRRRPPRRPAGVGRRRPPRPRHHPRRHGPRPRRVGGPRAADHGSAAGPRPTPSSPPTSWRRSPTAPARPG